MLSLLRRQATSQVARNARWFSEAVPASEVASTSTSTSTDTPSTPPPTPSPASVSQKAASGSTKPPYFIPRNTNGNLPVYSDIKNQGNRQLVHIRNIEGNPAALVNDLRDSLFPADSREAEKMKIVLNHQKHIVITGGRWRNDVFEWLKAKGF